MGKLRLVFYDSIDYFEEVEIKGKPIIISFPAYSEQVRDWVAVFDYVE